MATIQIGGKYRFDFRNFDISVLSGATPFIIGFKYSNQMRVNPNSLSQVEQRFVGLAYQDGKLIFLGHGTDTYELDESTTEDLIFEPINLLVYNAQLDAYVEDLGDVPTGELFDVQLDLIGLEDDGIQDYFEDSTYLFDNVSSMFELLISNGYSHAEDGDTSFHIYCGGFDVTSYYSSTIVQVGGRWYVRFEPNNDWDGWFDVDIQIVAEQRRSDYDITFNVVGATYSPTTDTYNIHDDTDAITFTASTGYTWEDSIVRIIYGGVDVTSTYWDSTNHQVRIIQDIINDVHIYVTLQPMIQVSINHNNLTSSAYVYKPKSMMMTQVGTLTIINITQENGVIVNITYTSTPLSSDYQLIGLNLGTSTYLYLNTLTLVSITSNIVLSEYIAQIPSLDTGLDLYIYQSSAEINVVDKSSKLAQILHITGILREGTTLVNPTIIVESSTIIRGNYAWIPQFERYYFIEDIVADHYNKWRIVLRCDVLMSYRDKIRQQTGFIARNEFEFNDYLIDEQRLVNANYVTNYESINDELIFDVNNNYDIKNTLVGIFSSPKYQVEEVRGNRRIEGFQKGLITDLPHGTAWLSTKSNTKVLFYEDDVLPEICDQIMKGDFSVASIYETNPLECVISIRSYPFKLSSFVKTSIIHSVFVGNTELRAFNSNINAYQIQTSRDVSVQFTIDEYFHNFMDYAPYTKIRMYIPYINYIDLDVNRVMGTTCTLHYIIDFDSGVLTAIISNQTGIIITASGKVGVDLPLTASNESERERNKFTQGIQLALGIGGSAMSLGYGLATGKPLAVVGGIMGMTKSIASNGVNEVNNNQVRYSTTKGESNISSLFLPQRVRIEYTRPNPIPVNESEYNHLKGKPLGEYRTLSTMSGFTILDNIHLKGFNIATEDEIKEIETHLLSGVIL